MHHRFSIDTVIDPLQPVLLRDREYHHAVRVLRIRAGEAVEIFDSEGRGFEAVVAEIRSDSVALAVTGEVPARESSLKLTLALALIKPEKFELVLQKATELGVTSIVPLLSERVEVGIGRIEKKMDRWERIIEEAVKQSGRAVRPSLGRPTSLEEIVAAGHPRFILDADASSSILDGRVDEATLLIGPEGGFSEEELRFAIDRGCRGLRLGPRRLRAETAAIAAVTLAQSAWGDMRLDFRSSSDNN